MDAWQFDRLTRALGERAPRRALLALLATRPIAGAAAKKEKEVRQDACQGLNRKCTRERPCCAGTRCRKNKCRADRCRALLTNCSGLCVDLRTDPAHCGACGNNCGALSQCVNGACAGPSRCVAGLTLCGRDCVDLQTNPAHCGACGNLCAAGQACAGGACVCHRRLESCESAQECCQDAARAPLAGAFDASVDCAAYVATPAGVGSLVCAAPPPGRYCCVRQGAICTDDCDCCGDLRCLGEVGCGQCIASGLPCPLRCPVIGPCTPCCTGACHESFCGSLCKTYGSACEPPIPCCDNVPCTGGRCRYD